MILYEQEKVDDAVPRLVQRHDDGELAWEIKPDLSYHIYLRRSAH